MSSLARRPPCMLGAVLAVALSACSAGAGATPSPAAEVAVQLNGEAIRVSVSSQGIYLISSAPGRPDVSTSFIPGPSRPAIHFSSFSSDGYLYGVAPAGAASLAVSPEGVTAIASDGTFVAAIGNAPSPPSSIHWTFLNPSGAVLAQGDGPTD